MPSWLNKERGLLLEIGCSVGWFCGLAVAMGWLPVGLDISFSSCREAKEAWDIITVCSDSLPLPFKSQTFHLVLLRHSLEHLFSPKKVLSDVRRVLKEGGWVVLEVPNANSLGRKIFAEKWDTWELPRHLHHFTPKTLRKVLEQAGFKDIKIVTARHKPFLLANLLCSKRHPLAELVRILLGLPTWVLLPFMMVCQEGEVLRGWAQKQSNEAS
ncbi:MAG: class I SAM-dependent methyltransferase [Armatimonadetes bacterium]|nr:class I SAM-dependent methyltransferase [Armatimonadota bacterium]MCX7968846.1 class I SAM-dependent methyltransferase [Armatimonadota bacterium]MDW8144322.1 class I SAM-dependent methyltransferase [Armatimonadota bacterium]